MKNLQPVGWLHDGTALEGLMARPEGAGPFPSVMVMHSGAGLSTFEHDKSRALAQLGYLAVATDMFGVLARNAPAEENVRHYEQLIQTPTRMRERIVGWFDTLATFPDVDAGKIAAIGYCFGGMCVLELARSGVPASAVVSYHGVLTTHAPAQRGRVKCRVAAYCGGKDPYASLNDVESLRSELSAADVHYQITEFATAEHGFTNPEADAYGMAGIGYNEIADRVSWAGTLALLETVERCPSLA
jgi:dienelactone hydrolase